MKKYYFNDDTVVYFLSINCDDVPKFFSYTVEELRNEYFSDSIDMNIPANDDTIVAFYVDDATQSVNDACIFMDVLRYLDIDG